MTVVVDVFDNKRLFIKENVKILYYSLKTKDFLLWIESKSFSAKQ